MTAIPLGNRVLVARLEAEEKTQGGIIIPDSAKDEKPAQGKIIAVGEGETTEDGKTKPITSVKVGDTVLFAKWGGNEIKVDGEDLLIINTSDLLAKITG